MLKRIAIASFLVLTLSMPSFAQKKWYAPFKTKSFWIGEAIICAGVAFDDLQTAHAFKRFPGLVDRNIFIGNPPHSRAQLAKAGIITAGIWTALHTTTTIIIQNDPSPAWRALGSWGVPIVVASGSTWAIIHNRNLEARCELAGLICK